MLASYTNIHLESETRRVGNPYRVTLIGKRSSPVRNAISTGSANFSFSLLENKPDGVPAFFMTEETGSNISQSLTQATPAQQSGCVSGDEKEITHQNCASLFNLDLTAAFHTPRHFVFEITQTTDTDPEGPAELSFCFLKNGQAGCQYGLLNSGDGDLNRFSDASIIYPSPGAYYPILLAHVSWCCGFGCGGRVNAIWAYDPPSDKFNRIWIRGYNCWSGLKLETNGKLAGDMIAVDENPTGLFPWPYGIEVYKFLPPDRYVKILDFIGRAGQGGKYVTGPLDAIDSDMPEILRRLKISN